MSTHPVLTMKHGRSKIWKEQATDEDFMTHLADLASIFALRKQQENADKTGKMELPDELLLFKEFRKWRETNG
jgi:hypothetical protein